jgi:ATP-dependent helicase HrpB
MPSEQGAREALPVRAYQDEIARAACAGTALVLAAETGSGKTTQVPQILFAGGIAREGLIVVLQPRRLAARSIARRVAAEMGTQLGELVGFRTRYERAESARTKILFVTDGLFVRMAQESPRLDGIAAVVLDEFHERTIATDLAAGLVRRLRAGERPDLRLVVMSATLDASKLATAFGGSVLDIPGRLHPVEVSYGGDTKPGEDPCRRAAAVAAEAMRDGDGDALIFMPGRREIAWTIEALARHLPRGQFDLLELHGSQSAEEQDAALAPARRRRIVVATNIAETSLTIPGITLVVDSGLARVHRFDPLRDLNALRVEPISLASARQRMGRAGRVAPGRCIRMWSRASENRREEFDTPEVHRVDLAEPLLWLAAIGVQDASAFAWIDPPKETAVARGVSVLQACGAFDGKGAITQLGRRIVRLPAHPRIGRALVEAADRGCVERASVWASIVSERDCAERADAAWLRRQLDSADRAGDLVARERAIASGSRADRSGSLDTDAAREVRRAADDLARAVSRHAPPRKGGSAAVTDEEAVATCFMLGFPDRVAWRLDRHKSAAAMRGRRKVSLDRRSLHDEAGPLLAFEVRDSGSGDAKDTTLSLVTPLLRAWVERVLPERFTQRREARWDPSSQSIVEVEERLFDACVIEQTVRPPKDLTAAGDALADQMVADSLFPDDWEESAKPWLDRVRWVREAFPDKGLPAFDAEDLRLVFRELTQGCSRINQVRAKSSRDALSTSLSHEERQFVQAMAPESIKLPTGFAMKIAYAPGQAPRGRAKIQDFYGLHETPRVGGGRVPVLLEILGPNHRPLQVTADLGAFWKTLYPQLRGELQRRYPRHKWV